MICSKCGANYDSECKICDLLSAANRGECLAVVGGMRTTTWPQVSKKALAVAKDQVADANERNKHHGVNVTYNEEGHAIIPDNGERKKLLALEGFFDRDAFN